MILIAGKKERPDEGAPPGNLEPPGGVDGFSATNAAANPDYPLETPVASHEATHPQHQARLASVHSPPLPKLRPVRPRAEAVPPRAAADHQPGPEAVAAGGEAVLRALPGSERGSATSATSSPSQPASHSQLQSGPHLIARQPPKPAPPSKQCQDPAAQEMETFV